MKPSILATMCVCVASVLAWWAYAIKKKKLSVGKALKQPNGFEPMAWSTHPKMTPFYLFICRFILFLWTFPLFVYAPFEWSTSTWSFFTIWNWGILTFYFLSGSLFALRVHLKGGVGDSRCANAWRVSLYLVCQVELALALTIDICIWCFLFPLAPLKIKLILLSPSNIHFHLLNFFFLLFDFWVTHIEIESIHVGLYVVSMAIVYGFFSWIYWDIERRWRYFFLDTSVSFYAVFYVLVFSFYALSWWVVFKIGTSKRRMALLEKSRDRFRMSLSGKDTDEDDDVGDVDGSGKESGLEMHVVKEFAE